MTCPKRFFKPVWYYLCAQSRRNTVVISGTKALTPIFSILQDAVNSKFDTLPKNTKIIMFWIMSRFSPLVTALLVLFSIPDDASCLKFNLSGARRNEPDGGGSSIPPQPDPIEPMLFEKTAKKSIDSLGSFLGLSAFEVPEFVLVIYDQLKDIVLYKPPVGLVAIWTLSKLVLSGRLFRLDQGGESEKALQQATSNKRDRRRHRGRAFHLDKDDIKYQFFGGVERVRRRLCWAALSSVLEEEEEDKIEEYETLPKLNIKPLPVCTDETSRNVVTAAVDVLKVNYTPGGSRTDYVQRQIEPMARLERSLSVKAKAGKRASKDMEKVIQVAAMTAEIRILDGLFRMARDRLLRKSFRLSRTRQHWRRRVKNAQRSKYAMLQYFLKDSVDGDRMRLAFAQSAYNSEVVRLGKVVDVLMELPQGLDDSLLTAAVQNTAEIEQAKADKEAYRTKIYGEKKKSKWSLPEVSKFSFGFNWDGRGRFTFRTYEESLIVGGQGALQVLLEEKDTDEWLEKARNWSFMAREMLCDIVESSLDQSIQSSQDATETAINKLKGSWCASNYDDPESIEGEWTTIYEMIRDLHQLRRVGEGKTVRLKDSNIIHWARQWDLLGIPSATLHIGLASVAHKWLLKHWPTIRDHGKEAFDVAYGIFKRKFWIPVRDVVNDILNRGQGGLLQGISVKDEELSLDNMLRDLNFGDGTPGNRQAALSNALRQYEDDLNTGLFRHVLGGRLVRLILIQVQQLKVGLLSALESIDLLLQANKLNFQLLGTVPAVLLIIYGTKFGIRSLYNLRAKDLRPIGVIHSEMTEYLNELESVMLLTDRVDGEPARSSLNHHQLGEFALTMYDYLVLLDYSSAVFPNWQCDAIHKSMQEFLGSRGSLKRLNVDDQLKLIDQIKRKHESLANHL
jgi:nuclear-control-of-ATPase protein 2